MAGAGIQRTLDRLRFGPRRTLNVREVGLTGTEAARRVDGWLRARQVELAGDVLIITGRGAGSRDGIAVVRDATQRALHALRRAGVVANIQEDTPGSFMVTLASLRSLLEAPARRKLGGQPAHSSLKPIQGIGDETQARLKELALCSLDSLGVNEPSEAILRTEMERQFSLLASSAPTGIGAEPWISQAITRGLRDYEESNEP